MTFFYDLNKRLKDVLDAPKSVHQTLNEGTVAERSTGDYSAAKARAGKDIGKPGKNFEKIAKSAGEHYGSKERGEKVAGAVLAKLRAKEDVEEGLGSIVKKIGGGMKKAAGKAMDAIAPGDEALLKDLQKKVGVPQTGQKPRTPIAKEEYGPLEEKSGAPMTAKQKSFAKLAPPADKITFADKIAGAKQEVDEMLGDVAAEAMKSALKGKQKQLDRNHNGKIDAQDLAMLRKGGKQEMGEASGAIDYDKVLDAIAALYGPDIWDNDAMQDLANDLEQAGPTDRELDFIIAKGKLPKRLAGIKFAAGDDVQFGEGWDDMMRDVERRRSEVKPGHKVAGAKGDIEKTATGIRHTRRYDPKTGETDSGDETGADGQPAKRGRGRPKGTTGKIGAKGPSGTSKLMTREGEDSDIEAAKALLKKAGYKVSKGTEELDEKAVSQNQAVAARIARGVQKGEAEAKPGSASAEMAKMKPTELKKFAKTDTKDLPKKVKAKEEVEETTVAGSVAPSAAAPKGKSGMTFGKGIYDSMNREVEAMIAESMNVSMNISNDAHGGPSKSLTVTATDDDAEMLGKLLKMAGLGSSAGGCGCGSSPCSCNSAERVEENKPDWPTDEVVTGADDDHLTRWAGGLNKPKTTVAGDGQTTVPVTAVQVREEADKDLEEQEQVMAPESKDHEIDEELQRMREMAGIASTAKVKEDDMEEGNLFTGNLAKARAAGAKEADLDGDGDMEKVRESINSMWKAYKA